MPSPLASSRVGVGQRVEERKQLGRALGDGGALAGDGGLVAAGDRAGQRALGPARGPVLDGGADERDEQVAVGAGRGQERARRRPRA